MRLCSVTVCVCLSISLCLSLSFSLSLPLSLAHLSSLPWTTAKGYRPSYRKLTFHPLTHDSDCRSEVLWVRLMSETCMYHSEITQEPSQMYNNAQHTHTHTILRGCKEMGTQDMFALFLTPHTHTHTPHSRQSNLTASK